LGLSYSFPYAHESFHFILLRTLRPQSPLLALLGTKTSREFSKTRRVSEKRGDAFFLTFSCAFWERGFHFMKVVFKLSRVLTTIFLIFGLGGYIAYVAVNKANGGRTTDDVNGWFIFDAIVFGAIIVGLWVKKARPLV